MEYSKDIVFNIKYNDINTKVINQDIPKFKKWTSSIKDIICNHIVLTIIIISCLTLMILDVILILDFINILQNTANII